MKKVFLIMLCVLAVFGIGTGIGYFVTAGGSESQGKISPNSDASAEDQVNAEPVPAPIPAEIAPQEDFSPDASAVIDSDGYLNIPDNTTVEYVETTKIKTKYFTVSVPGCWTENIVAECRYINEINSDYTASGETPVLDTLLLTFYEKDNYLACKASGKGRKSAATGELTEIRFSSTKNDNTWLKTSNYENYVGSASSAAGDYDVFIYEPHDPSSLTQDDYAAVYKYLSGVNYEGCLINNFHVSAGGTLKYADEYVVKGFIDGWDPNAEGIPAGSKIPDSAASEGN